MQVPATIESFQFYDQSLEAFIPAASWIQEAYLQDKAIGNDPVFPYWATVWPAAKALCAFIALHPEMIKNKTVLELAAGVGLPSLLAARSAKNIIASDYIPAAVDMMQRSVIHNHIHNMQTAVINWNDINDAITADVLLLSDINYDPSSFQILYTVLQGFIEQGTTILLSTPQRIAGKVFMERLQPWCRQQEEIKIIHNGETVYTNVWVIRADLLP
jgi:predicted nicotinamide N-methyase